AAAATATPTTAAARSAAAAAVSTVARRAALLLEAAHVLDEVGAIVEQVRVVAAPAEAALTAAAVEAVADVVGRRVIPARTAVAAAHAAVLLARLHGRGQELADEMIEVDAFGARLIGHFAMQKLRHLRRNLAAERLLVDRARRGRAVREDVRQLRVN